MVPFNIEVKGNSFKKKKKLPFSLRLIKINKKIKSKGKENSKY
jgi:hypothetical protein